jgi:hypothetical protein
MIFTGCKCAITKLIENIKAPVIDPDTVFSALEEDRHSELLAETITTSPVRYQASLSYPGQLEKITTDGEVTIGQFSCFKIEVATFL